MPQNVSGALGLGVVSALGTIVYQPNHRFKQCAPIYFAADERWYLARADQPDTLMQAVVDSPTRDQFTAIFDGLLVVPNHGCPLGQTYYLSPTAAGEIQPDEPTQPGEYSQAVFRVWDRQRIKVLEYVVLEIT